MRIEGLSPRTVRTRRYELDAWARWIGDRWPVATRADVVGFYDSRRIGDRSRRCGLSHLAAFYRWARLEGLTDVDPVAGLRRPKVDRALPRPTSDTDLALAFLACGSRRDLLILALAALAGLRCCEIARMRWVDVDLAAGVLTVTGKGRKQRSITMHEQLRLLLRDEPRASVFVLGRAYAPGYISDLGSAILTRAGFPDETLHKLRHRFGTVAYRASRDLLAVAELMGHQSVTTTQVYAEIANLDGARVIARMPPIGASIAGQLVLREL